MNKIKKFYNSFYSKSTILAFLLLVIAASILFFRTKRFKYFIKSSEKRWFSCFWYDFCYPLW